jgi:hypothetical protein
MPRPALTHDLWDAMRELANHRGWFEPRYRTRPDPYRILVSYGYAERDGHGKFRLTDDGREHFESAGPAGSAARRIHPKAGARRKPKRRQLELGDAVAQRHQYGSSEKILRRNRKTWTRLGNKRRRAVDKKVVRRAAA